MGSVDTETHAHVDRVRHFLQAFPTPRPLDLTFKAQAPALPQTPAYPPSPPPSAAAGRLEVNDGVRIRRCRPLDAVQQAVYPREAPPPPSKAEPRQLPSAHLPFSASAGAGGGRCSGMSGALAAESGLLSRPLPAPGAAASSAGAASADRFYFEPSRDLPRPREGYDPPFQGGSGGSEPISVWPAGASLAMNLDTRAHPPAAALDQLPTAHHLPRPYEPPTPHQPAALRQPPLPHPPRAPPLQPSTPSQPPAHRTDDRHLPRPHEPSAPHQPPVPHQPLAPRQLAALHQPSALRPPLALRQPLLQNTDDRPRSAPPRPVDISALDLSRDTSMDVSGDVSGDVSRDVSRDASMDVSGAVSRDASMDVSMDVSLNVSGDVSMDVSVRAMAEARAAERLRIETAVGRSVAEAPPPPLLLRYQQELATRKATKAEAAEEQTGAGTSEARRATKTERAGEGAGICAGTGQVRGAGPGASERRASGGGHGGAASADKAPGIEGAARIGGAARAGGAPGRNAPPSIDAPPPTTDGAPRIEGEGRRGIVAMRGANEGSGGGGSGDGDGGGGWGGDGWRESDGSDGDGDVGWGGNGGGLGRFPLSTLLPPPSPPDPSSPRRSSSIPPLPLPREWIHVHALRSARRSLSAALAPAAHAMAEATQRIENLKEQCAYQLATTPPALAAPLKALSYSAGGITSTSAEGVGTGRGASGRGDGRGGRGGSGRGSAGGRGGSGRQITRFAPPPFLPCLPTAQFLPFATHSHHHQCLPCASAAASEAAVHAHRRRGAAAWDGTAFKWALLDALLRKYRAKRAVLGLALHAGAPFFVVPSYLWVATGLD
jgi:hypothetical protein